MTQPTLPSTDSTSTAGANGWTRCVVLSPAEARSRSELVSLLASRDWQAVEHDSACAAMAELCVRERALAARGAWGLGRGEQLALVVAEPRRVEDLKPLVAAIRMYLPAVSVWAFDDGALTRIVDAAAPVPVPVPAAPPADPSDRPAPPPLRLAPGHEERGAGPSSQEREAMRVSSEELRMLLQTEPRKDDS